MFRYIFLTFCLLALSFRAFAQQAPRLVVQIVVSQMRYDYLTRFGHNFGEGGLRRMMAEGAHFTNARYDYAGNNTPAGLATLLSGASPAAHGIVAHRWLDYTTNEAVQVVSDAAYFGLGSVETGGQYAPTRLTASTIGDELKRRSPASRVIAVALEPSSAVVGGGRLADAAYWFDPARGNWCSSTWYMDRLPIWVDNYNTLRGVDDYNKRAWDFALLPSRYVYSQRSEIFSDADRRAIDFSLTRLFRRRENEDYFKLRITPAGVEAMMEFVRQAIIYESLGKDEHTDLLTITADPLRYVTETYGTEAMETEDAVYRLDAAVAALIEFAESQAGKGNVLFVLTADHGSSDTHHPESRYPQGLFNAMQFRVLMNGFLNTQYGQGEWVMDYVNHNLYLNHRLAFERGVNLAEMQAQAAAFALQFRGVAHAVTANALQNNYFAEGAMQKIQNGFYPKNSGDILISLMPGWIEEVENTLSLTGSHYEYDTHVPLLWYGAGIPRRTVDTPVSPADIAPTLARMLNISRPDAATGHELPF